MNTPPIHPYFLICPPCP